MAHWKLLFPSDYVGSWDLDGKDVTVTIARIVVEGLVSMQGNRKKSEDRPILYFKGKEKKLVLNKTNAKVIAKLYGPDTDKWMGKRITLYATTCEAFGETVDCLRVRAEKPRAKKNGELREPDYDPETGEVPPDQEPTDDQLDLTGTD